MGLRLRLNHDNKSNAIPQAWFDQYTDTDLMSVTTDDVPSLYSMTPTPSMTHRSRFSFHFEDLR